MCAICDSIFNDDFGKQFDEDPSKAFVPGPREPVEAATPVPEKPTVDDFENLISKAVDDILKGLGLDDTGVAQEPSPSIPVEPEKKPMSQEALFEILDLGADLLGMDQMIKLVTMVLTAQPDEELVLDVRLRKRGEKDSTPFDPAGEIKRWHKAVGQKGVVELDDDGRAELIALRRDLHTEEAEEVEDELYDLQHSYGRWGSRARLAMELADQLVIAFGTADLFEIDLPAVFNAVMAKNWEKINPVTGRPYVVLPNGKVGKPEGFKSLTEDEVMDIIG
ncbi:hypothetical protein GCM10010149_87960 [Nonomuraea roseoviolacea subsp. roseoviolacea]|uniref:hypothetical protein n=1 Tax=Nonomuraea roseoviolacea TaxID=103837 RepID=UPI0031DA4E37